MSKSERVLVSNEYQSAVSKLLTIEDVLLAVDHIAVAEGWKNPIGTVRQAMYRGNLQSAIPRKRGVPARFTREGIEKYVAYLENRAAGGGAKKRHKLERFKPLIGVKTDSLIAALAGCSNHTVFLYRHSLGIFPSDDRVKSKLLTPDDLALIDMSEDEAKVALDSAK